MLVAKVNGDEAKRIADFISGGQEITFEVDLEQNHKAGQLFITWGSSTFVKLALRIEEEAPA